MQGSEAFLDLPTIALQYLRGQRFWLQLVKYSIAKSMALPKSNHSRSIRLINHLWLNGHFKDALRSKSWLYRSCFHFCNMMVASMVTNKKLLLRSNCSFGLFRRALILIDPRVMERAVKWLFRMVLEYITVLRQIRKSILIFETWGCV